jgi:hypothetical protein
MVCYAVALSVAVRMLRVPGLIRARPLSLRRVRANNWFTETGCNGVR